MSEIPAELKYTKDHEWLRLESDGTTATVGITAYAQESLGDITYVELPGAGDSVETGDTFGAVESVKAASDLYAPISGEVTAVNEALENAPELINDDPFGEGWIIKIEVPTDTDLSDLLDAAAYKALTA
ncbi:MAG: glycine cleavage system protein GcvH [Verrucomicrobiota bacterium]